MKELEIKAKEMERLNRAIEDGLRRVGEAEVVSPASVSGRVERSEGKSGQVLTRGFVYVCD